MMGLRQGVLRPVLFGVAGLAALGAAGAAGYLVGQRDATMPQTRLTMATCGLAPAPLPLQVPLVALLRDAGDVAVTLGPILHPGLDAALSLRFRALRPDEAPRPKLVEGVLELPLDPDRPPDALHLSCRYGAIARVEYRRGPLRHPLEVAVEADLDARDTVAGRAPRG